MKDIEIKAIQQAAEMGRSIHEDLALEVLSAPRRDLPLIFAAASAARERHFGSTVHLCSIFSARSGACTEDCAFCAQASCHATETQAVPLRSEADILDSYRQAAQLPISHFGVVTSGCALSSTGVDRICSAIRYKKVPGLAWCASLGCLGRGELLALKKAGLTRFHHNLETSRTFFPSICTTHTYDQRLTTVRNAREAGLEVCCGGIMGVGESPADRVELAVALAAEEVDSIPLNFLIPIRGTKLENMEPMKPLDMLCTVAVFRLTNPRAEIRVCAGRVHLGDLQSMMFHAGASGMMTGPLLTVAGRNVEQDLRMLDDLEVDYVHRHANRVPSGSDR